MPIGLVAASPNSTAQIFKTYAAADELMMGYAMVVVLCWLMESALGSGACCFTTTPWHVQQLPV